MDGTDARSLKRAGRRLVVGSVMLVVVSFCYYAADEVAFTYRELDGYLPILPIVRLGFAIVAGGLLIALVYPASVLVVRLPLGLRRHPSGAQDTPPSARDLHVERALDAGLSLIALAGAYSLVDNALQPAVLPFGDIRRIEWALAASALLLSALIVLMLVREVHAASVGSTHHGQGYP